MIKHLTLILVFFILITDTTSSQSKRKIVRTCAMPSRVILNTRTKVEILALLPSTFNKRLVPPKLFISDDSLTSLIKYPDIAKQAGVKGIVIVEFCVDSVGEVGNIKIAKGIGAGCDEAVKLAFKKLYFIPAKINGISTKTKMRASINFKLWHPK